MSRTMTGGCACGRVAFAVQIRSDEAYLCHCRMCQRATGSVSFALKNVVQADVMWDGDPRWYRSSPIAHRPFCPNCGTSLGFAYFDSPNMDLAVGAFHDPGYFRPTSHFGAESMHRAWLDTSDLPQRRTDEHQPVVDRWIKAVGKLPD